MNIQPFSFDRVFDAAAVAAKPDARMLLEQIASLEAELNQLRLDQAAELARVRSEAFQAGFDHAREGQTTALLSAADALQAGIEAIDGRWGEMETRLTSEAAEVAIASGELLAGRALELNPGLAVDEAIGRALKQVARGTELQVRVHPELVPEIERLVAIRQSADRRRLNVTVVSDASLDHGDAMIGWDQGGLVMDAAARSAAIRSELQGLLRAA